MGHTVLAPDASVHIASPNDAALLLADLVRAVRLGDRVRLLEPLAQPWGCAACMAAYAEKTEPGQGERWRVCGMLHDMDWERHPTRDDHLSVEVRQA